MDKIFYKKIAIVFALSFLIFLNANYWNFVWLGFLLLGLFLFFASIGFKKFISRFFDLKSNFCVGILSAFFVFSFVSSLSGIFILFFKLNAVVVFVVYLLVGLLSVVLDGIKPKDEDKKCEINEEPEQVVELSNKKNYIAVFLLLIFAGLYFLWQSRSGGALLTPWQVISGNYIYLFFLSTLVLGGLIFSRISRRSVLMLIVIAYLAMFAYLPLSHQYFWGADGWRHLAALEQIKNDSALDVVNYSTDGNWIERINPGLVAYSQFWGALSVLNKTLNMDLIVLIAWLQPILAGIMLPIIIYQLGIAFGFGKRKSLFLTWLGLWPFALQAVGAFSLPVNFGFLFFLAILLLLVKRMSSPNNHQIFALFTLFVLSFFGYSLYLILFAVCWVAVEKILYSNKRHSKKIKTTMFAGLIIFAILIIPFTEFIAGYAKVSSNINFVSATTQAVGNFFGYYLASGPRDHIIETGNVFFYQTPIYAFWPNGFTQWRYWIIIFMLLVFLAMIFGVRYLKNRGEGRDKLFIILSLGIFFGYIISRYYLDGSHLLTRRLEPMIAFCAIFLFFAGIHKLLIKKSFFALLFIFLFSIGATASYSLGPVSRAVSRAEFESADKVWQEIKDEKNYCVIGGTYHLLALEAKSAKKVIGGGFPIDKNFAQPELVWLYEKIKANREDEGAWNEAKEITKADKCYLLVGDKIYSKNFIQ